MSIEAVIPLREPGRPRSFSDEEVYAVIARLTHEVGFEGLTLAAIAKEVGCTGQALNARFGSRLDMLAGFVDWASAREVERFDQVRAANASPLAALRARFDLPMEGREEEIGDGEAHIRIMSVVIESERFPEFALRFTNRIRVFEEQMARLIDEAIEQGELKPVESGTLSHLLMVAITGSTTLWPAVGQGSVVDEVNRTLELILRPYLP